MYIKHVQIFFIMSAISVGDVLTDLIIVVDMKLSVREKSMTKERKHCARNAKPLCQLITKEKKHEEKCDGGSTRFSCTLCEQTFVSANQLFAHERITRHNAPSGNRSDISAPQNLHHINEEIHDKKGGNVERVVSGQRQQLSDGDNDEDCTILPFRSLNSFGQISSDYEEDDDDDDNDKDDDDDHSSFSHKTTSSEQYDYDDNVSLKTSTLIIKALKQLRMSFDEFCQQTPTLGNISSKYDINLVKEKLAYRLK
ncbi:hypothetical protein ACF0H5_009417 [Mactra antiquata]